MSTRVRAIAPLAISIGVVAFLWSEFALNFSFHWVTVQDGVFGKFGLPEHFQIVLPASFVTWGLLFVMGADGAALRKTLIAATTGTIAAVFVMVVGPALADAPHFWGIAVAVGVAGCGLVLASTLVDSDLLSPAPAFACAGTVLLWWFATGLDNYVPGGKGPHTVQALGLALTTKPLAAGTGAFGGLLSTPWPWVAISVWVTFVCGALLGVASGSLAALVTPRRETESPAMARAGTA
jgi:hypothetical protein